MKTSDTKDRAGTPADCGELGLFLRAANFAAKCHRKQKRKDGEGTPYINHPIEVANFLCEIGKVTDPTVLAAAVLHDTIEDTDATEEDLRREFGEAVLSLVLECTDDKSLPKAERKKLQIVNAPHKTPQAACIKIADKISNVKDVTNSPPPDWPLERRREYLDWTEKVVAGLRGHNKALEELYDKTLADARKALPS